ncbi:MAG: fibronectin type III domain-containing protein [Firmicutes bacterium]|nr:fibronectin type III domain-containing protein [Bacillota bacterium]
MLGRKIIALIMALAMVMTSAAFVFADEGTTEGTDPVVTTEDQTEAPAKADQVIKVAAEKKVVVGRADKIAVKLEKGDGALSFETSDKKVVTVDKNGKIKAKAVGAATITIKAAETEKFNAAVAEVKVTVVPKAITITSLVCKKHGKFTVKWKKLKDVTGFEVQFCKAKNFKKGAKIKAVKSGKATTATVKKLKKKARFYVRIRVYKTVNGVKYYSDWSKAKSIKIK